MFISGIKKKIMETKKIRFEKGVFLTGKEIKELLYPHEVHNFMENGLMGYTPIKSFTVQINIIEDEPVQPKFECYEIHVVQARMYGCKEQCKECEEEEVSKHKDKLIEDEES